MSENEFAVRWGIRRAIYENDGVKWTKWHWTIDTGKFTLCGLPIVVGRDDVPMFPQTQDESDIVDCFFCKRRLGDTEAKP